jgi:hypothetical protein
MKVPKILIDPNSPSFPSALPRSNHIVEMRSYVISSGVTLIEMVYTGAIGTTEELGTAGVLRGTIHLGAYMKNEQTPLVLSGPMQLTLSRRSGPTSSGNKRISR